MCYLVGEYLVDVSYFGKAINGSPYRVHAIDWTSIRLSNLNSGGIVGRLVEFDSKSDRAIHLCLNKYSDNDPYFCLNGSFCQLEMSSLEVWINVWYSLI